MNDYTKGILTGASLILCFFMFVSAKTQDEFGRFDEIDVKKLIVRDQNGWMFIDSNSITLGKPASDNIIFKLSQTSAGGGLLTLYNKHNQMVGYFGSNEEQDGNLILSDRYGDPGWGVSGKK